MHIYDINMHICMYMFEYKYIHKCEIHVCIMDKYTVYTYRYSINTLAYMYIDAYVNIAIITNMYIYTSADMSRGGQRKYHKCAIYLNV